MFLEGNANDSKSVKSLQIIDRAVVIPIQILITCSLKLDRMILNAVWKNRGTE